jgi:hypothetical protein
MISNIIVKMAIWYQYPGVKTQDGDELHDATPQHPNAGNVHRRLDVGTTRRSLRFS